VTATPPAAEPATPASESGLWVGWDQELARLRGLLGETAAGHGATVLVEGYVGSGKTALLSFAAQEAAHLGFQVLRGAADGLGRDVPLLAVRECLGPESADVPAEGDEIVSYVRALTARTPTLIMLDDLHFADGASVLVWQRLAAVAPELPLLLLASRWPASPHDERLRDPAPILLRLEPLAKQDEDRLVHHLAGAAPGPGLSDLTKLTDGNPQLLHDVVAALIAEGALVTADGVADVAPGTRASPRLLATVASRLAGLPPATLSALRLAALLGRRFGVADLAALAGLDLSLLVPMLTDRATAGILGDAGGSDLRFRSPLVRQALYADIPVAMRALLHHEAAQILAQDGGPDSDEVVDQVARHLFDAGEPPEGWALDWLVDHARPLTVRVPVVALGLFQRAVDHAPNNDLRMAVLWKYLSASANRVGRRDAVDLARRFQAQATDPDHRAFADMMLSAVLLRDGRADEALEVAENGEKVHAGESEPQRRRATRFLGLRARILCYQGRYADAEPLAVEVLERAGPLGDPTAVTCAHHVLGRVLLARRDHPGALAALDAGLAVSRSAPRLASDLAIDFGAARALLLDDMDWQSAAQRAVTTARRVALRTQALAALGVVQVTGATLHYSAGRWDAALKELAAFDEEAVADAWLPAQAHGLAALILAHRGRDDEADERLARVPDVPIPAGRPRSRSAHLLMARALRAEADGRPADALAALAVALDPGVALDLEQRHLLLPEIVRLALAIGDESCAQAAVHAAETEVVAAAPARAAAAQRCRGMLMRDPGPLLTALEYYRRVQRPLELARTWEDLAAVTAARGDLDEARAHLNQTVDAYVALGADGEIARADARMRALGVRRGRRRAALRPGDGWEALTPTEVKVAGLVAKGRSNREIAVTLSLSPRTVQTHVSHILVKLGFGSRSQIAGEAAVRLLPSTPTHTGRTRERPAAAE
jgi:DNA-binding CsgD family transcriptional regulator/tetratricopeptide (TPR) repeat protein